MAESAVSTAQFSSAGQPQVLPAVSAAFTSVLVVYWLMLYVGPLTAEADRGSIFYLALVVPVALFAFVGGALVAWAPRVPNRILLLAMYVAIVCAVAATRGDVPTITSTVLTMLTLMVLTAHRLTPSPNLLNVLFLLSIPMSMAAQLSQLSIYSVIPFLSNDEDVPFRISLFPFVLESAFFSAVVLILNILNRGLVLRRLCMLLSCYFVLLSGLRSAIVGLALALFYYFVVHRLWYWRPAMKMVYFATACVVFVGSLVASQLLLMLAASDNAFVNTYLFRAEAGVQSETELTNVVYRSWLWLEHLRIAAENPILGVGTFDFTELAIEPEGGRTDGTGSEAFLTGLYARVGLPSVLFILFLGLSIWRGVKAGRHEPMMVGLLLLVAMLVYGSFLVPYNFMFLTILSLVCTPGQPGRVAAAGRY
jgi:hypothetical protein